MLYQTVNVEKLYVKFYINVWKILTIFHGRK